MTSNTRVEHDSMGALEVPAGALWGAQTQRAIQNFPATGLRMPRTFIRALGLIKHAAADANARLKDLPRDVARAIKAAALEVAAGRHLGDRKALRKFRNQDGLLRLEDAEDLLGALGLGEWWHSASARGSCPERAGR